MDRRGELLEVIRSVRNRWRQRLALRGAVVVVAGTLLALFLSASSLQALRFSPAAIITFRFVAIGVFAALVWQFLARALRRQVTDGQVALYLEEHDPSLEAAILSAIEATSDSTIARDHSPHLVEKLVDQAIAQCRSLEHGHAVDRQAVKRHVVTLGGGRRRGAAARRPRPGVPAAGPVGAARRHARRREVEPVQHRGPARQREGAARIRPGRERAAHRVHVEGRDADDADVGRRGVRARSRSSPAATRRCSRACCSTSTRAPSTSSRRTASTRRPSRCPCSTCRRSASSSSSTTSPPTPGLPPQKVELGGDVAALRGTEVRMKVTPTMASPDGKILVNESGNDALTKQADGTLTGKFTVKDEGFYKIELTGPHGEQVDASPKYTIDVLNDQPPVVSFTKPGRDSSASPVEEVFVEAKANDDFGVKQLQMFYSVNGGAEKTVKLFGGRQAPAGGHGGPHDLPRGARREARRLRVLLREGHRQQRRRGREDDDERHLLREHPAVPQGLQAGAVAGRRRGRRRRRRRRAAVGAAARRSSRRRSTPSATSRSCRPRNTARTSCSSTSRRRSCARRWTSWSASSRRASASSIRASRPLPRRCRRRRPR